MIARSNTPYQSKLKMYARRQFGKRGADCCELGNKVVSRSYLGGMEPTFGQDSTSLSEMRHSITSFAERYSSVQFSTQRDWNNEVIKREERERVGGEGEDGDEAPPNLVVGGFRS